MCLVAVIELIICPSGRIFVHVTTWHYYRQKVRDRKFCGRTDQESWLLLIITCDIWLDQVINETDVKFMWIKIRLQLQNSRHNGSYTGESFWPDHSICVAAPSQTKTDFFLFFANCSDAFLTLNATCTCLTLHKLVLSWLKSHFQYL